MMKMAKIIRTKMIGNQYKMTVEKLSDGSIGVYAHDLNDIYDFSKYPIATYYHQGEKKALRMYDYINTVKNVKRNINIYRRLNLHIKDLIK